MQIIKPSYTIEKLDDGDEILARIERAGRTCYKSEDRITPDSAKEFVAMILERGHHSVIEHEYMTVRFICDRGVTHELVRHRLVAYSQESTRYCNYSKGKFGRVITVIEPCFWDKKEAAKKGVKDVYRDKYKMWKAACMYAQDYYNILIEAGASPQEARSVLPNSLKTEIVTTANLREWRHIFTLRTSKAAHPQMREIMVPLLEEVKSRVPVLFDDITPY
jgi:thymidylate synthase (FAD)